MNLTVLVEKCVKVNIMYQLVYSNSYINMKIKCWKSLKTKCIENHVTDWGGNEVLIVKLSQRKCYKITNVLKNIGNFKSKYSFLCQT